MRIPVSQTRVVWLGILMIILATLGLAIPTTASADSRPLTSKAPFDYTTLHLLMQPKPEVTISEGTPAETSQLLSRARSTLPRDLTLKGQVSEFREAFEEFWVIGKKIWDVIKANAPVVNTQYDYLTIIPSAANKWTDLTGWQSPRSLHYDLKFKNLMGIQVVRIRYALVYSWGGQYQGRGAYLANVMVVPEVVDVAWGYKVSATSQTQDVVNTGTNTYPIPGANLTFKWLVSTPMKHIEGTSHYFVKGDGSFQDLSK